MHPVTGTFLAILVLGVLFAFVVLLIFAAAALLDYLKARPALKTINKIVPDEIDRIEWVIIEIDRSRFKWPESLHFTSNNKSYVLRGVASTALKDTGIVVVRKRFVVERKQPTVRINGSLQQSNINDSGNVKCIEKDNLFWDLAQKKIHRKIENIAKMENL